MNIKKQLISFGAAVAATVAMVSPASATIYTYTRTDGIKLVIDTVKQTGSFSGPSLVDEVDTIASANIVFAGAGLANFNGASTTFATTLSSLSGTLTEKSLKVYTAKTSGTFTLTLTPGTNTLLLTNGGPTSSWATGGGSSDYFSLNSGTLTSINPPPVNVPEPAMLGLFGAGAVMVMMGRRRRSVAKSVAGTGKLALAC